MLFIAMLFHLGRVDLLAAIYVTANPSKEHTDSFPDCLLDFLNNWHPFPFTAPGMKFHLL